MYVRVRIHTITIHMYCNVSTDARHIEYLNCTCTRAEVLVHTYGYDKSSFFKVGNSVIFRCCVTVCTFRVRIGLLFRCEQVHKS